MIDELLADLAKQNADDPKHKREKACLLRYKEEISGLRERLGDFRFEDSILDLPSTSGMLEANRDDIYSARCYILRENAELQSSASIDVEPLRDKVLKGKKSRRKPHGFDTMLTHTLIDKAKSEEQRIQLEKHFSFSHVELEKLRQTEMKKAGDFIDARAAEYQPELNEFYDQFADMQAAKQKKEAKYQGRVLDRAMHFKGMSPTDFVQVHNEAYPETPIDERMLRKFVHGKYLMNHDQLRRFATIVRLDISFFMFDK